MATIDHSSLVTVVAIEGSETATVTKGQQQEKMNMKMATINHPSVAAQRWQWGKLFLL